MSREKIQEVVNKILANHPAGIDFDEFQKLLLNQKIEVHAYAPGGVLKGVSYSFDSLKWPGSKIGREFSTGLSERGVRYQQAKAAAGQQVVDPFLTQQTPPTELKRTLPAQPPQHQIARVAAPAEPETPVKRMGFDLEQIADLQIGPLSKVMLFLGGAVANLGISALRLLLQFVQRLLAKLGFGMRPIQSTSTAQAAPERLEHEPFVIEAEARQVTQSDVDEAARQVFLVAEAVTQKEPDLLPFGEGRAELVEALTAANSAGQATVNFKADPEVIEPGKMSALDELFAAEADCPDEPEIDELEALKSAVKAQNQAEIAVENAPKVDTPEVVAARQSLARAGQKLRDARAEYQAEKLRKPKLLQFAFPSEKDALSVEIAAEAAAKAALADSISKHPSKPPAELISSLVRARLTTAQIAKLVADEALKSASLNPDPEVKKLALSKANSLQAQAELLAKFPTIAQANIVLNAAESGQLLVAAKRDEVADLARLEVQRALQIRAPQELDSEDAPR